MQDDFLSQYLSYTQDSEAPTFFHRWACISGIGAYLGRQYYFQHGHMSLYTNLYTMLIGSPGTRKNTSINMMRSVLLAAGYDTIAADKTTKEKFLMDLAGIGADDTTTISAKGRANKKQLDQMLENNLWGENNAETKPPAEVFIVAPEFNDFLGNGNMEFISLLGNLWDYSGVYRNRIKNGHSIFINNPTISIIGGNTPTGFSLAFPAEALGQGFFSRLLLVYSEPSGRRITFPTAPSDEDTKHIVEALMQVKKIATGPAAVDDMARSLLDKIYHTWNDIDDVRFAHYSNRRFTHLLKLCLVIAASRYTNRITEDTIVAANTILTHTEYLMPKALGEFGKSKNSDVVQKIIVLLEETLLPLSMKEIWSKVSRDLEKMSQLSDILVSLKEAEKILFITGDHGKKGFIAKKKVLDFGDKDGTLNWELLTQDERNMI